MDKSAIKELLFGRLASVGKFVTEEQIAECLQMQERYRKTGSPVPRLGEILSMKGYMKSEQVRALLDGQHNRREGLFGEVAVRWSFLERGALDEVLEYQRGCDAAGKHRARLGEILVERGLLRPHQVRAVLEAQGKKIVHCSGCNARFNVAHFQPGARLTCAKCSAETVLGEGDRHVTDDSPLDVLGTVWLPKEEESAAGPAAPSIGGYEMISRLGSDGTGQICKARHQGTGNLVALKVMRPGPVVGTEFLEKFLERTRAAIHLDHPNLKRIYEVGADGDRYFLAEEFIEGKSLKRQLELVGKMSPSEATDFTVQIAEALEYGHRRELVHGDVRPSNVLIDEAGRVRLAGLGVAKDAILNLRYFARGAKNTPFYLAPEQAVDPERADSRSDIYALGAMLYHMLTGRPPYVGQGSLEMLMRLTQEPLIPPDQIVPEVPKNVSDLVVAMLAAEPDERPQTIGEVLGKLRRLSARLPALGIKRSPPATASVERVPTPSAPLKPAVKDRLAAETFEGRRFARQAFHEKRKSSATTRLIATIVVVLLIVGAFALFLIIRPQGGRIRYESTDSRPRTDGGTTDNAATPPVTKPEWEAYGKATDFKEKNSGDDAAIAAEFKKLLDGWPGPQYEDMTSLAGKYYREHQDLAAGNILEEIKKNQAELAAKGDYVSTIAAVNAWAQRFADTSQDVLDLGDKLKLHVADAETAVLDLGFLEFDKLMAEKKFDESAAFLDGLGTALSASALDRIKEKRTTIAEAQGAIAKADEEARKAEEERKKLEEENKRKEAEAKRLALLAAGARGEAARLAAVREFGKAKKALAAVKEELAGSEHLAALDQMAETIGYFEAFNAKLVAGVKAHPGRSRLTCMKSRRPVVDIDAQGLTVSLGGGAVTRIKWADAEPNELVEVAIEHLDNRDAAQVMGFAIFCNRVGAGDVAGKYLERAAKLGAKTDAVKAVLDADMLKPPPPEEEKKEEEKKEE